MAFRRLREIAFQDDSTDSDEEFVVRRPRWIREREDHFAILDDIDFAKRFRLSKHAAQQILILIEDQLEFRDDRNNSVSPINQLLCALRFYATGCHQITAGDFSGVSTSTAHRIIHRVSVAIASLLKLHIIFPQDAGQIRIAQSQFFKIASFPRTLGAIDCTHIKIQSPGGENAEVFRCRKGYFSLNVQGICNANLEFTDIVARWPGSTHDARIFRKCNQKTLFENGTHGSSLLVGDSAYACTKYMMTPLPNPQTAAEHLFNESQIRTRNVIERTFGVWKKRFPALALGLRVKVENAIPIIVATAILHNILRRRGEPIPAFDPELQANILTHWDAIIRQGFMDNVAVPAPLPGRMRRLNPNFQERRQIIELYFTRLERMERRRRENEAAEHVE